MSGKMERIMRLMAERQASDVFLSANMPILIKIHGQMLQLSDQVMTPSQPRQLLSEVLSPQQLEELDDTGELNLALALERIGSFRVSAFKQRGTIAAVVRHIPHQIPPLDTLNLPEMLGQLVQERRGLILLVGATGSGKSTTLAAMLELRNRTMAGHILTIEEPIEFLFQSKRCVVNQREVGRDTESLQIALKNALRQSPDCIMIGEIRDRETMSGALSYALSGHLVLASMHANNSYHALGRILSFYSPEVRPMLQGDLAAGLRAVVSQRLMRASGGGRIPAVEILLNNNLVGELLERGDFEGIKEAMQKSLVEGSRTFEDDIARLVLAKTVSQEEGIANADSATDLIWRLENQLPPPVVAAARTEEPEEAIYTDFIVDVGTADALSRRPPAQTAEPDARR